MGQKSRNKNKDKNQIEISTWDNSDAGSLATYQSASNDAQIANILSARKIQSTIDGDISKTIPVIPNPKLFESNTDDHQGLIGDNNDDTDDENNVMIAAMDGPINQQQPLYKGGENADSGDDEYDYYYED